MAALQIKERIRSQAVIDVDPPLSAAAQYMRQDMTREGYRHLLAVGACGDTSCLPILRSTRWALRFGQADLHFARQASVAVIQGSCGGAHARSGGSSVPCHMPFHSTEHLWTSFLWYMVSMA